MSERWLPVVGYEGLYEVSDEGRVRSIDRVASNGSRRRGLVLVQTMTGYNSQYHYVGLSEHNVVKVRAVHRLVAEAFHGLSPAGMECRHLDGNPSNNSAENLRWGTKLENSADSIAHGVIRSEDHHWNAKITKNCIARIRDAACFGVHQRRIAEWFGLQQTQISRILNGSRWGNA